MIRRCVWLKGHAVVCQPTGWSVSWASKRLLLSEIYPRRPIVNAGFEVASLRAGYACTAVMLVGMLLMGFIPPHSPAASADTIAALYGERRARQ